VLFLNAVVEIFAKLFAIVAKATFCASIPVAAAYKPIFINKKD
jgi:hypothetical protein